MITMIEGNSADFDVTVSMNSVALDITGCKAWFTIKLNYTDTDEQAILQVTTEDSITVYDPTNGKMAISITPAQALGMPTNAIFHADLQIRTAAGKVYTVLFEQITIMPRVTAAQNY